MIQKNFTSNFLEDLKLTKRKFMSLGQNFPV